MALPGAGGAGTIELAALVLEELGGAAAPRKETPRARRPAPGRHARPEGLPSTARASPGDQEGRLAVPADKVLPEAL
eukprot:15446634-Alexandrium_andersonii.AAC.1